VKRLVSAKRLLVGSKAVASRSGICEAGLRGHWDVVDYLLSIRHQLITDAPVGVLANELGFVLLHAAVRRGREECLLEMLQEDWLARYDAIPATTTTVYEYKHPFVIRTAISRGDLPTVRRLCARGGSDLINREHATQSGSLAYAISVARSAEERLAMAKVLLDYGANPNGQASVQVYVNPNLVFYNRLFSPLLASVMRADFKVMELLLTHGANPNGRHPRDVVGASALHQCMKHHCEVVEHPCVQLLRHGANINALDQNHWTPLIRATAWGSETAVIALLSDPILKIDACGYTTTKISVTALQVAVIRGQFRIALLLIRAGARIPLRLTVMLRAAHPFFRPDDSVRCELEVLLENRKLN
jgi:ankyrin repeat protein